MIFAWILLFFATAIFVLDSGLLYENVSDIESVKKIEKGERKKLHIPDNVVINFIIDTKISRNVHGYVDIKKSSKNSYFIYLEESAQISTVSHEIYHVYRVSKLYPSFTDPEWQKNVRRSTLLKIMITEQFLAYVYGWFGINLEF